ncbi:MAG: hypothetical protein IKM99_04525 [Bacteroidales bacterium]|nr:hypothetical protein [Bacteroidales bacterium]
MEDFFLFLRYKNKTIKFKITDPNTDLEVLMNNLRKAVDNTGTRIFDLPEMIDYVPTEYFFGKKDEVTGRDIILQPKVGKTKKTLLDYNVKPGDTLEVISDPIAG